MLVGSGLAQFLRLGSNLLLARLLFPESFGLMALVWTFLTGLGMFSDVGISPSIVQSRRGDDPSFLGTAWTIQILRGIVLWFVSCLVAWPVAMFYDQPQLFQLLPVSGLTVVIAGFNSTALLRLIRHLNVRRLMVLRLVAQISSIVITIGYAFAHPSVWALVAGSITYSLVLMALSHLALPDRTVRLAWDREGVRDLFRFGRWIFLSTTLTFLGAQADILILGRMVPIALLGVYSIATKFSMLAPTLMAKLGDSVLFPAFSRKLESGEDFASTYRRTRAPVLAAGGLAIACTISCSQPLIQILYDARYADAAWMLQLLIMGAWFRLLMEPSRCALLALGSPNWLAAANATKLVGVAFFMPAGFWLHDLPGAIVGFAVADGLSWVCFAIGSHRRGLRVFGSDLAVSALLAVAALGGLYAGVTLETIGETKFLQLVTSFLVAAALWLPCCYVLFHREVDSLAEIVGIAPR